MTSFEQSLELMLIDLQQVEGPLILIGVCDDLELREHAVKELSRRLPEGLSLQHFTYDPEHLSLLEGVSAVAATRNGRVVVSVTRFEDLPHDKRTEAIKLLNLQRNRFGYTDLAVVLWVSRDTLAEISRQSADFYSWRSGTFIIEPPPDWDTLASARRSYLHALVNQNQFVNLQGLAPARGGHIVQMRMEDIFIPLRVDQEVMVEEPRPFRHKAVAEPEEFKSDHEREDGLSDPDDEYARFRYRTERRIESRPAEIADLLKERRAVVLGDPGAGKTTLLRYLAYMSAYAQTTQTQVAVMQSSPELQTCLPIYVRIGEYSQHLQHHPATTIEEYAPQGCQARQLPLSEELLRAALASNQAVFLLDGLDEVIATDFRRAVAEQLAAFARRHPQCRMFVTSRIVGYRETQLSNDFTQFTIRPFDDSEIQHFAQRWYAALGEPASNAERLVEAITGNASVRRLAANPLLLTVIALIHWRGTKLPQHRAKLYSQAAETLVDQWMSYRRVNPEGWDAQETLQTLLPAIAWHLHSTTSSGLIGEQELHILLVATLRQHNPRLSEQDAHTCAAQFRRNVSEFSGIFLERGLDQDGRGLYGFLHLTFEEYFAAVQLADQWQRGGQRVLKPLLHNSRWTEVLLLAVGHLGDFSPYLSTQFVKDTLKAKSEYEKILHRDLLLAARCLAEDISVDEQVRQTIVKKLLKLYFDEKSPQALREDLRSLFASLGNARIGGELLGLLTERLSDSDAFVREVATLAVGQLGVIAATPEVLERLHRSLTDPVWFVRGAAASAIGQLGPECVSPEMVSNLLNLLESRDSTLRMAAARAIGKLGQKTATPAVLATLLENLTNSVWEVCNGAGWALEHLGPASATAEVENCLLTYLTAPDTNGHVRSLAAHVWGKWGRQGVRPKVLITLSENLTNPDSEVRRATVETLGQMGSTAATPEVVAGLLACLSDEAWEVGWAAVEALGQMGSAVATPKVVTGLMTYLREPQWGLQQWGLQVAAAKAVVALGVNAAIPEVLNVLVARLLDANWYVRPVAAEALGSLGGRAATPEVLKALVASLREYEMHVRVAAAQALGGLGARAATPEVLRALVRCLRDNTGFVRSAVAQALQQLSIHPQQDRSHIVQLILPLTTDQDAELRNTGYVCLRNLLAGEQAE